MRKIIGWGYKWLMLLSFLVYTTNVMAQQNITGSVTDEQSGKTLPGVNILVKGTSTGASTDQGGNFELAVPSLQDTLVVSFVGYKTQQVPVNGRTKIDVALQAQAIAGEEMVVVGFGKQKKENLTGSVAEISGEKLAKRGTLNSALALEGQVSGLKVRQLSGNPMFRTNTLTIRGKGTFSGAGSSPLVLVDGIETSLANIDPANIESTTVLKDASAAAIYGSKAANGVILVQTKEGTPGEMKVTYNSHFAKLTPTDLPEMVNSWEYAEAINEANASGGLPPKYTEKEIQKFKSGTSPINYPNFDHLSNLFHSGRGLENKQTISINGGDQVTQYLFSGSYYNQLSTVKKNNSNKYQVRLNLNTKLNNNLNFNFKTFGNKFYGTEPVSALGATNLNGIVLSAFRNSNAIPGKKPNGYYGMNGPTHPEADLNSNSFNEVDRSRFYGNAKLTWDITNSLNISGTGGYRFSTAQVKRFRASYPVTKNFNVGPSTLNQREVRVQALTLRAIMKYSKKLDEHNFNLIAGFESNENKISRLSAYRDQLPNNQITQINIGSVANSRNGGQASMNTLESFFGRAGYNYREKYLLEFNYRYDGSSRFSEDNRWGFFPSVSAGWRISNENFIQDISWINNLKIRASWGQLGNQAIGNYPYQNKISLDINYPFGNKLAAGGAVTTIPTENITWETTTVSDIGLDMALFDNRLNVTADYYIKETKDILYNISVSRMLGASPSPTNAGTVKNKGLDFSASYNNTIGDFSYDVSANFSIVHNKVTKLANVDRDIGRGLFKGYPIGSAYGYVSDGLYANEEDVKNFPATPFPFMQKPGGIKLVDISGPNGKPDGKVTADYDRTILGNPAANTTYGLTLSGGYKNFDFYFLLQGAAGRKTMQPSVYFYPLGNTGNVQRFIYENRWKPGQPNGNAKYPRIQHRSYAFYTQNKMSFWFRSATYARLKTVNIGYTLPNKLINNSPLEKVHFYISGENLFTITDYFPGWDPEMQETGGFYPLLKKYTAGIQIEI